MLVDKFAEFIESLSELCADCAFVIKDQKEQLEITIPGIVDERNIEIYIPKDKLEEFLQSIRDMEDHEDCLKGKAR